MATRSEAEILKKKKGTAIESSPYIFTTENLVFDEKSL